MNKKYYLVLDTETATLPCADFIAKDSKAKQKIAIAKPLVYDIGWLICDRNGNPIKKVNYLVNEIFNEEEIFNTAYYKEKRPIYLEKLEKSEIFIKEWEEIVAELLEDMKNVEYICAYNATFDFKKAIPYTDDYISHSKSTDFMSWLHNQFESCLRIIEKEETKEKKISGFYVPFFNFRGYEFPIVDIWASACDKLINQTKYKNFCLENNLLTNSALYFKTSAETSYQYLTKDLDFEESHTALDDAEIETMILVKILKKGKLEPTLRAFPFRDLGTTVEYVEKKTKYKGQVLDAIIEYNATLTTTGGYKTRIENIITRLS